MTRSTKCCKEKLKALGQEHLINFCDSERLLLQIDALDEKLFSEQRKLIHQKETSFPALDPPETFTSVEQVSSDCQELSRGRVGCLIVAGGQGTRLGFKGAKGIFPLGSTSLYRILAEKTALASRKAHQFLPIALMTSSENHEETVAYFKAHDFFGLVPEQIDFFVQTEVPFLDDQGNLFIDPAGEIAQGPDGNGWALKNFLASGLWEKWYKKGVHTLNFTLIDNVLADPFDPQLINFHVNQGSDITVKAILREDPYEKVGIFARKNGMLTVVEYTEIQETERIAKTTTGQLAYPYANISLFAFNMAAIPGWNYEAMPWHLAHKPAQRKDLSTPLAWKFEKFIFDLIPFTSKVKGLLYPREQCFIPLKSAADIPAVLRALQILNLNDNITS